MRKVLIYFIVLPLLTMILLSNQTVFYTKNTEISGEEPTCKDCHSILIENKTKHPPAIESCDACHQVNIKDHTENGTKGLNLTDKLPDLCFSCHDGIKNEIDSLKKIHLALNESKSCVSCHSPHSSKNDKLLISEEKTLCLSCHNKDKSKTGEKIVNIENLLLKSKVIHPVINDAGCIICHKPHVSINQKLLKNTFPAAIYATDANEAFGLCFECHNSDMLKEARTTSATNFRDGDKNLHLIHLKGNKSRSCILCHNVHASMNNHLIEDKVAFGNWMLPLKYISNENGGSCSPGCHKKKEYKYQ
jgi:predicted CXXCH cytochrome family protein